MDKVKVIKAASVNIALSFLFIFCAVVLHMSTELLFITIILSSTIMEAIVVIKKRKPADPGKFLLGLARLYAFLWIITLVGGWLGLYGLLGFAILILLLVAYILYSRWSFYMEAIRDIERQIWGETMEEKRERKRRQQP